MMPRGSGHLTKTLLLRLQINSVMVSSWNVGVELEKVNSVTEKKKKNPVFADFKGSILLRFSDLNFRSPDSSGAGLQH